MPNDATVSGTDQLRKTIEKNSQDAICSSGTHRWTHETEGEKTAGCTAPRTNLHLGRTDASSHCGERKGKIAGNLKNATHVTGERGGKHQMFIVVPDSPL